MNTQNIEATIKAYETEKTNLETQVANLDREKIILEEQLRAQNEILMTNFNTVDPTQLAKIAEGYQAEIIRLEEELKQLDVVVE